MMLTETRNPHATHYIKVNIHTYTLVLICTPITLPRQPHARISSVKTHSDEHNNILNKMRVTLELTLYAKKN